MKQTTARKRIEHFARLDPLQVRRELSPAPGGLSRREAEQRRREYGANQLVSQPRDTVLYRLRRAFINPFSLVLALLAVISFITDVVFAANANRNTMTVLIIVCMLLLSGTVRFLQELRSKKVMDRLTRLVNTRVSVLREGRWQSLEAEELVVGDLVRLAAGERVPADLRLLRARECFVSQSVITGESAVLPKTDEAVPRLPAKLTDCPNLLFRGTTLTGGSGLGVVLAVGADTLCGGLSADPDRRKDGFDRGANSIAWVLIRFMALLVPLVFVASGLTKGSWLSAFLFALSVAVGLTPELLPMVITACLAKGSFSMGQKQTIVKNINAMQGFGSMDVLCVDKTGTLTGDTLLLEYYMDILGNESGEVLDLAFLNSCGHTGLPSHLDSAILRVQDMPGRQAHFQELALAHERVDELPFDYSRRVASVLLRDDSGLLLVTKGGPDEVLARCSSVWYRGQVTPIGSDGAASAHAIVDEMLEDGMKVLAVAARRVDGPGLTARDEADLTLVGYLAFFDAPKKSAAQAIRKLNSLHVGIKVLTGDSAQVAASICRRLDIPVGTVLTGERLDALSDNEIQLCVENTTVFAELSPRQKAQIVSLLRSNGHSVGFLGDGMNDLPAVIGADVGISVDTAAQAVKEAADVILLKKDLGVLEAGILEGRRAFANMSKYIKITASSNLGNILAIVLASIALPFFPMTAIQILLLNLLYDLLCLVLPWDSVDPELCEHPLEWSGQTLSRFMLFFGPLSSLFDLVTFLFLFGFLCPSLCGGPFAALSAAGQARFISLFQTGWFLESMWTQVLILHLLRTQRLPLVQSRPSRPVLAVTVLGIALFTLLAMTPLGQLIGLTCLPPVYFVFLVLTVCCYLFLVTVAKKLYVRRYRKLL